MLKIIVQTIPHKTQRYETVGDWYFTVQNTVLNIFVSDMGNPYYEFLVAQHEQTEAMLCLQRGIEEEKITAFDKAFEARRQPGDTSEPGDNWQAPYRREHFFATSIERLIAGELNLNWEDYDGAVNGC